VADALQKTFGEGARVVFCLGLFSAAYSSYLINSMIGGYMAADGLGWDVSMESLGAKLLSTLVLLVGMLIGLAVILFDFDRTPTIIVAQAITVVVAPLVAGVLLWLTSSRQVMGQYVNGWGFLTVAVLGFLILVTMALKTALVDLPAALGTK
jgi:manganese transport protein